MNNKAAKVKRYKHPAHSQQEITELDYWNKLSQEEKNWLNEFHNGYYSNNHRNSEVFTSHPEYSSRIKKEMDSMTNARNRDLFTSMNIRKRMDSLDHLKGTLEEAVVSKLLLKELSKKEREQLRINFGVDSFETASERLMRETADLLKNNPDELDPKFILLNFYLTINCLIKDEMRERRKAKKEELAV